MWSLAIAGFSLLVLGGFLLLQYAIARPKNGEPSPEETVDAEISTEFQLPNYDSKPSAKPKIRLVAR